MLPEKITLFGLPGTGTSTIGKQLSKKLGYTFFSSGNAFRELAKSRYHMNLMDFTKYVENHLEVDIELDKYIESFGKSNSKIVVDSRLAFNFIPDSYKIALICLNEIRFKRIAKREKISYSKARRFNLKRELSERKRYLKLYNIDLFKLIENNVFDLIIDTSYKSPEEIIDIIIKKINSN
jgi:predicted cytidylate kinase